MSRYVLGVDSSTGSTKVEVIDLESGKLVGHASAGHPPTTPPVSEQHPDAWWTALTACLGEVAEHLPFVDAMAISGQQHGMVLLDGNDHPVRPAKLWNDTTSAAQSQTMVEEVGATTWAEQVGSIPGPSFTVTKLAWMAQNEPEILAQAQKIGLPHDFLNLQLTGNWVTDRGDASGTGYWSPASEVYVAEAIERAGGSLEKLELPRVAQPFESIGTITNAALVELGLSPTAIVAPGSGDNMGAALGLGLVPGDVVVSLGTSGTAYAVSNVPTNDARGLVAGFADATGNFLPLVCTLNATKVTESIRKLLNVDYDEFDELALAAPQGANGVTLVPYFDGERTPNLPDATGSLVGLRTSVERSDIARAAFEGVACGLLDGVDALVDSGVVADGRFFLIGGGSRSQAFREVFASLSGRDITIPINDETVARGAAVQAACALTGDVPSVISDRWNLSAGTVIQPSGAEGQSADDVRSRYRLAAAS